MSKMGRLWLEIYEETLQGFDEGDVSKALAEKKLALLGLGPDVIEDILSQAGNGCTT